MFFFYFYLSRGCLYTVHVIVTQVYFEVRSRTTSRPGGRFTLTGEIPVGGSMRAYTLFHHPLRRLTLSTRYRGVGSARGCAFGVCRRIREIHEWERDRIESETCGTGGWWNNARVNFIFFLGILSTYMHSVLLHDLPHSERENTMCWEDCPEVWGCDNIFGVGSREIFLCI